MLTMDLLDKEEIRNFIYDTSNKKLLIGSRGSGKTTSLLLALARNCSNKKDYRPSTFIVMNSIQIRSHYETLKTICNELGINLTALRMIANNEGMCEIEGNKVKFVTSSKFNSLKGYKYKDTYIDEPNLITDLNGVLDNVFYRTCSYNNPKLLIAGSSTVQGEKLKNLSADTSYSRHVINIEKYITNGQLEELKNMMTTEQFATEIQCKFV